MTKMLKIIWADNFLVCGKKKGTESGWLVKMGHQSPLAKDVCFKSWDMYVLGFPGGSVVKNLPAKYETQV